MKHLTLKIQGRVQGVFFRKSAKEAADKLGIFGAAWNEKEGSVLIEAEAEEAKLNEFLQWAKKGPRGAVVKKIEENWSKEIKGRNSFEIKA